MLALRGALRWPEQGRPAAQAPPAALLTGWTCVLSWCRYKIKAYAAYAAPYEEVSLLGLGCVDIRGAQRFADSHNSHAALHFMLRY